MANKKSRGGKKRKKENEQKKQDQQEWYKQDISLHQDQLRPELP